MDITLKCKVSLSKKLRVLMGKSGNLLLNISAITEGRGEGILSISGEETKEILELNDDLKNETSIMLTPVEVITNNIPNTGSLMHASIFTSTDNSPLVRKLAAITPPEKGQESRAIKENIEVPETFKQLNNPKCKEYINSMSELIEAAAIAKNKKSTIDINTASSDRERAIMLEMKEREEAIDVPAWIINESVGSIRINDLDISLLLNSPLDLSTLSARRIINSKDLRGLISSNLVKFIDPNDVGKYMKEIDEAIDEQIGGLEVFDRHEDAEASISNVSRTVRGNAPKQDITKQAKDLIEIEEVNDDNIEELTEEENTILNLTQNMPRVKTTRSNQAPTPVNNRTVHGNNEPAKKPTLKPIKKLE